MELLTLKEKEGKGKQSNMEVLVFKLKFSRDEGGLSTAGEDGYKQC